jgi:hypothetical protein
MTTRTLQIYGEMPTLNEYISAERGVLKPNGGES